MRFVRMSSLTVLVLAVMLNVLYVGHGGPLGGHPHISNEAEAAEHAAHCHLGPKQCSSGFGSAKDLPHAEADPGAINVVVPVSQSEDTTKVAGPPARLDRPPRGTILFNGT